MEDQNRERDYRNYVTDILRISFAPNSMRYVDIFKPEETRSAEDIKNQIKGKLNGLIQPVSKNNS